MMKQIGLFICAVAAALTGCVQIQPVSSKAEHVSEKNYTIGVERTAVVGESIIRLKDYTAQTATTLVVANEACHMHAWQFHVDLVAGQTLPVVGSTDCESATCLVARAPESPGQPLGILVAADGRVQPNFVGLNIALKQGLRLTIDPPTCRLLPAPTQVVDKTDQQHNYEIVYSGTDGQSMRFSYREYTVADMARPAYSQDFAYPLTAREIKFRDVRIDVVAAKSDSITYIIRADGMPALATKSTKEQ